MKKITDNNGYIKGYQKDENEFTFAVLLLCKSCLEFGFYNSPDDINSLMKYLLKLLNGTLDVTTKEEVIFFYLIKLRNHSLTIKEHHLENQQYRN